MLKSLMILDHTQWLCWQQTEVLPVSFDCLPHRFILILNPPLYLKQGGCERIEWTPFQNQELQRLKSSTYQIISSLYLCDLTEGFHPGGLLDLQGIDQTFVFKNEAISFQAASSYGLLKTQDYLKRFGVMFDPKLTALKSPSYFILLKNKFVCADFLEKQHQACWRYLRGNFCLAGLCLGLGLGAIFSGVNWVQGVQAVQHYKTQASLSQEQQDQALLYQAFSQLEPANLNPNWKQYEAFLAMWQSKIVVTQLRYESQRISCQFILHPDHGDEIDRLSTWVTKTLVGANLLEQEEGDGEFQLSFAAT